MAGHMLQSARQQNLSTCVLRKNCSVAKQSIILAGQRTAHFYTACLVYLVRQTEPERTITISGSTDEVMQNSGTVRAAGVEGEIKERERIEKGGTHDPRPAVYAAGPRHGPVAAPAACAACCDSACARYPLPSRNCCSCPSPVPCCCPCGHGCPHHAGPL